MFILRKVHGKSMLPALRPGQIIVASLWRRRINTGDIVLFRHRGLEKIKRVQAIKQGMVYLLGDNGEHSTDSRQFGWLPIDAVKAKVIKPRSKRRV